jgi:hypothetical protein
MKEIMHTPANFAHKIGVNQATIYRWINDDQKRFKMYDAKVILVDGKPFISVKNTP